MNKAAVLVNRVNMFWGLDWEVRPEFLSETTLRNPDRAADVVIGCVDTRAARQIIERRRYGHFTCKLLARSEEQCRERPIHTWTALNALNRRRAERLRTVSELYPEIVDTSNGERSTAELLGR